MKSATSSRASSRSSAARSLNGTRATPGRYGPKRSVNAASPFTESEPSVSPWKACSTQTTRCRFVAARPSLIAASTDSVPLDVKSAFPIDAGARRTSSSASSGVTGEIPICGAFGVWRSIASISQSRTRGFERPTLNIPNPPSQSRYRSPAES